MVQIFWRRKNGMLNGLSLFPYLVYYSYLLCLLYFSIVKASTNVLYSQRRPENKETILNYIFYQSTCKYSGL